MPFFIDPLNAKLEEKVGYSMRFELRGIIRYQRQCVLILINYRLRNVSDLLVLKWAIKPYEKDCESSSIIYSVQH